MEYLDPLAGWTTLQTYIKEHPEIKIDAEHPALVKLLRTMKEKKVVHPEPETTFIAPKSCPLPWAYEVHGSSCAFVIIRYYLKRASTYFFSHVLRSPSPF